MPTAGFSGHGGTGSTMPREAHRPYRFGMTLLCFGGLLNWVGLFENYTEPVRYIGVTCVVSGAVLLCFAICCWLRPGAHRENAWGQAHQHANPALQAGRDPVHFITLERSAAAASAASAQSAQKPPDYDSVTDKPPSYDDAIKLSPALLWLANEHERVEGELLAPPGPASRPPSTGGDSGSKDGVDEMTVSEVDDDCAPPVPPPRTCSAATAACEDGPASSAPTPRAATAATAATANTTPATRTPRVAPGRDRDGGGVKV